MAGKNMTRGTKVNMSFNVYKKSFLHLTIIATTYD